MNFINEQQDLNVDIDAWVTLYRKPLLTLAFSITKDIHYANDCVQEAFIKAALKSHQLEAQDKFYPWISKIVINECKTLLKSKWIRSVLKTTEFRDIQHFDVHKFEMSELYRCLLKLPDKFRIPITLHYYQYFTLSEVAEILGIKESTCRVRIHRARIRLKNILEEEGDLDALYTE